MNKRTWLIGCGVCLVLAVVFWGLLQVATVHFNPMQAMFLTTFRVKNLSGVNVTITPIGVRETTLAYMPLPRSDDERMPILDRIDYGIEVPANGGIDITYNSDDVNFRHILVKGPDGRVLILDTDKRGTRHVCYPAQQKVYAIPRLQKLKETPKELIPCFYGKSLSYSGAEEYPEPAVRTE